MTPTVELPDGGWGKTPQIFSVGSSGYLGRDKMNWFRFDWCEMLSKNTLENGCFMTSFGEIVGNLEAKITALLMEGT